MYFKHTPPSNHGGVCLKCNIKWDRTPDYPHHINDNRGISETEMMKPFRGLLSHPQLF